MRAVHLGDVSREFRRIAKNREAAKERTICKERARFSVCTRSVLKQTDHATSNNYQRTVGHYAGKGRERSRDYTFPADAVQVEQVLSPWRGEGPREIDMLPLGRRVAGMVYGASDREPISAMAVRPIEYLSVYACLPALPACSANYPRPLALTSTRE